MNTCKFGTITGGPEPGSLIGSACLPLTLLIIYITETLSKNVEFIHSFFFYNPISGSDISTENITDIKLICLYFHP